MDIVSRESLSGGRGGFRAWGSCYIIYERARERQGVRGKLNLSLIRAWYSCMDLVFLVRSERERTRDLMRFIKALDSVFLGHIDSQESRKRESTLRSLTRSCHVTSCLIPSTTRAIPLCTRCGSEFKAKPRDTMFLNSHSRNLCKTKTGITLIISHMSVFGNFQDTEQ